MQPIITKEKKEGNQTDDRTWIDNSIHGVVACDMRVYEEVIVSVDTYIMHREP
jgi:hypothetical protein